MWLKVPDTAAFNRLAAQIESSPEFTQPGGQVRDGGLGHFVAVWRRSAT